MPAAVWVGVLIDLPTNDLTEAIIGCAVEVHQEIGPGLLERAYIPCLAYELQKAELEFEVEQLLSVNYKGIRIPSVYRIDLVVATQVAIEVKSVQAVLPVHAAQMLTYLRLGNYPVGLLMNFNSTLLKNGIKRVINTRYRVAPES